jgi:methyltransferase-like protein
VVGDKKKGNVVFFYSHTREPFLNTKKEEKQILLLYDNKISLPMSFPLLKQAHKGVKFSFLFKA